MAGPWAGTDGVMVRSRRRAPLLTDRSGRAAPARTADPAGRVGAGRSHPDLADPDRGVLLHAGQEAGAERVLAGDDGDVDLAGPGRPPRTAGAAPRPCARPCPGGCRTGCRRRRTARPVAASCTRRCRRSSAVVRAPAEAWASRPSRRAGSGCPGTDRRRHSTSGGRCAGPPPAARTARPAAGTGPRARGARARTRRRRSPAAPGHRTARRAWSPPWPAARDASSVGSAVPRVSIWKEWSITVNRRAPALVGGPRRGDQRVGKGTRATGQCGVGDVHSEPQEGTGSSRCRKSSVRRHASVEAPGWCSGMSPLSKAWLAPS